MTRQYAVDDSKGKYFTQVLNMADDDLGPYQMRLLVHYTRVAWKTGKCWEGVRTTARITRMSSGMVTKTRNELETLGYIRVKHRDDDTCVIVIVDRMAENVARYAAQLSAEDAEEFDAPSGKRSPGEQGVHVVNTSKHEGVHVVNERRYRTNKKTLAASVEDRAITADSAVETPSVKANGGTKDATDSLPLQSSAKGSPSAPPKSRERSAAQLANDGMVDTLRYAWFEGRKLPVQDLGPTDYGLYLKRAKELRDGGIGSADVRAYVEYWYAASMAGGWTLTLNSLVSGGRMADYKAFQARSATPAANPRRYDPTQDPAYAPLQQGGKK